MIGRATKDPELKFTPGNGTAVATFTLAVDRRYSKDGAKESDFIPIVVWGKPAETVATYSGKGKLLGVSGRIQTRTYDAKDGTKRYATEIVADEVQILEWNKKPEGTSNKPPDDDYDGMTPVDDGDIPF